MVSGITWEEETKAKVRDARSKQILSENVAKDAQNKAEEWKTIADALERALELVTKLQRIPTPVGHFDSEQLRKRSTWDNLVDIMKANNGLLIVTNAVTALVAAEVFTDRDHARNVIYSTLYSHKPEIEHIRQGVYRLKHQPDMLDRNQLRLKSSMSFRKGIIKVLQDAQGQPLHAVDIWKRMQQIGVLSNSENPTGWIDRMARGLPMAEKVAGRTWRWKVEQQNFLRIEVPPMVVEKVGLPQNVTNN